MATYYERICDRRGTILREERREEPGLRDAMARANGWICSMGGCPASQRFDPHGRVEIADHDGHPVARIYCAEVLASPGEPV
jgi:hypothetical protein